MAHFAWQPVKDIKPEATSGGRFYLPSCERCDYEEDKGMSKIALLSRMNKNNQYDAFLATLRAARTEREQQYAAGFVFARRSYRVRLGRRGSRSRGRKTNDR